MIAVEYANGSSGYLDPEAVTAIEIDGDTLKLLLVGHVHQLLVLNEGNETLTAILNAQEPPPEGWDEEDDEYADPTDRCL